MCVALPGVVEKIEDKTVVVDFSGNKVRAFGGFCAVQPGDRVLVHAGCILQVVSQSEAEEIESILRDMEDIGGDVFPERGRSSAAAMTAAGHTESGTAS